MEVNVTIKGVSQSLCPGCEYMDLEIDRVTLYFDEKRENMNRIRCKHYDQCASMLTFLNKNLPEEEAKQWTLKKKSTND